MPLISNLDGNYNFTLKSVLFTKKGILTVKTELNSVTFIFKTNSETYTAKGKYKDNEFTFEGTFNTVFVKIPYTAKGSINNNTISAKILSSKGEASLFAKK